MNVGVSGATGRMGQRVIDTASSREDIDVSFAIGTEADAEAGVPVVSSTAVAGAIADHDPAAIVDFSVPESAASLAEVCAAEDVALVVGTTGLEESHLSVVQEASGATPVLKATNFSRGIQALLRALGPALEALPGYDLELLETHHNGKRDAPSGTAKTVLETVAEHRDFETVYGREGVQPREDGEGEVGVLVRRAGDIRGEHEIVLADNDEVLTIAHRAEDRAVFAEGALDAAAWLAGRDPGWYTFGDVIDGQ
ncbi:MAG: 4-hydroxy-tetrahydrodipicolinate reductase [Natronomonas sp.]|jgi:4-hydroxy-tetrahydrodipicolinate reductase